MKRTFGAPVPYDAASYIEELEEEVDRLRVDLADSVGYAALGRERGRDAMTDLAAIRARDAACRLVAYHVTCQDRRALLAEVERMRALYNDALVANGQLGLAAVEAMETADARAIPVIEAARKVVERVLPDSPALYGPEMSDHIRAGNDALTALRAALAEYDR